MGVTFLYSSGIPILYPIAAGYFLVGYWADKVLLFRLNRKPPAFDQRLCMRSLRWYKFILVMHVLMGIVMYSNSSICPSKFVIMKASNQMLAKTSSGWRVENFFQLHILIFLGVMLLVLVVYLGWMALGSTVTLCMNRCCPKRAQDLEAIFAEKHP